MYSGRKIMTIMTKEQITITEGDTVVTYTVVNVPEDRQEAVAEAAAEFVRFLVESSSFASSEYTENNSKPVDY